MNEAGLQKLILHSSYNSFKNTSIQRGNLTLPASMAGAVYDSAVTFTLPETASFLGAYLYATDYAQYFEFLDSQYHNSWKQINNNNDSLLFSSSGLQFFRVKMILNGNTITIRLHINSGTYTVNHPTLLIPITVVSYRLAN